MTNASPNSPKIYGPAGTPRFQVVTHSRLNPKQASPTMPSLKALIFFTALNVLDCRPTQPDPTTSTKFAVIELWWALKDLNLRPTDYESAALTAELRALER